MNEPASSYWVVTASVASVFIATSLPVVRNDYTGFVRPSYSRNTLLGISRNKPSILICVSILQSGLRPNSALILRILGTLQLWARSGFTSQIPLGPFEEH